MDREEGASFQNKFSSNNKQLEITDNFKMGKHQSEPKFKTMKQQILRIPKVKQILGKDKYVYMQDIQKRIELIGNIRDQNFERKELSNLHVMRKPKQTKKDKRHKTNFKIPLTRVNVQSLNNLLKGHIDRNQKYKNQQVVFLKDYNEKAPFYLDKLKFMDELNPIKQKYKQKFPGYKESILQRNKLLLEHVILNRNIKRQMKLDGKKNQKIHTKNVQKQLSKTQFLKAHLHNA